MMNDWSHAFKWARERDHMFTPMHTTTHGCAEGSCINYAGKSICRFTFNFNFDSSLINLINYTINKLQILLSKSNQMNQMKH